MPQHIVVIGEQRDGVASTATRELVSKAHSLCGEVTAVVGGAGAAATAADLGAHGAGIVVDAGEFGDLLAAPRLAAAAAALLAERPADAVLAPATTVGRDVAGRLAARLDRPLLANVVGLSADGDRLETDHLVFGGTTAVRARLTGEPPGIFIIRPRSFSAQRDELAPATVQGVDLPAPGPAEAARIVGRSGVVAGGPSLDDAAVVVSAGRGLGEASRYALVERLAGLLNGAPAASRAIVDAGWVPYSYQVGQTGKTVKPDVYLAFGISGATQHLVGMRHARHIVAVNRDPAAPIFQVADLGVVGDAPDLLGRLIAALEQEGS